MFGKVLYFDNKKVNEYTAIITREKVLKIDKIEVSQDKGGTVKIPIASGNAKTSKSYEATMEESLLYDVEEFERKLKNRDDYFDFTISNAFELKTIQRGSIIKFNGYIYIPSEFDLTQLIGQFKPMILKEITAEMPSSEEEAFNSFLGIYNPRIPLISDLDDITLCSKIEAEFLKVKYHDLEEYESIEVTILARVIMDSSTSKEKSIFDPLKDFMSMNREARRRFTSERPEGLREIYCDSNYLKIEIITIYQ